MDKACSFGSFSSLFDWINIQVYGLCDELVAVAFLSRLICSSPGQSLMVLCGNVNRGEIAEIAGRRRVVVTGCRLDRPGGDAVNY